MSKNSFSRDELVRFGEYMVSRERKQRFKSFKPSEPGVKLEPFRCRLTNVHHADVENFINDITENPSIQYTPVKEVVLRTSTATSTAESE